MLKSLLLFRKTITYQQVLVYKNGIIYIVDHYGLRNFTHTTHLPTYLLDYTTYLRRLQINSRCVSAPPTPGRSSTTTRRSSHRGAITTTIITTKLGQAIPAQVTITTIITPTTTTGPAGLV